MDIDEIIDQKVENISDQELMELVSEDIIEFHENGYSNEKILEIARKKYRENLIDTIPDWIDENDGDEDNRIR